MTLDSLQWLAMAASVVAAWLVGSTKPFKRSAGFWVFVASNALWVAWGWSMHAYALIILQFVLCALNVRGLTKNTDGS